MIKIKSLFKAFSGNQVVKDLDLTIEKGDRVAIIGPSGIGKSTLLRLILGLQKPDLGQIMINGRDISKMPLEFLREIRMKFGMVFQSSALFDSMCVKENVAFPLIENTKLSQYEINKRVKETLELVGMFGSENAMPSDLSGGQKKRISLARAIVSKPEVILYDEPTTGLDPILSTNIEDLIVKLNDQLKTTSIVVTHQISTIMRTADKIYLMHDGKLLSPEEPKTIHQSSNEYVRTFIKGGLK